MSNVITIENTEMQIREYNGQRVVTFKDIDIVHHRQNGTSRKAFSRNKKHLIEGEDFFRISRNNSNETNSYGQNNPNVTDRDIRNIVIPNKGITVLTESGYLMIVKTFTDDLSWQVQRQLVNAYFKVKNELEQTDISDDMEFSERKIPVRTATTPVPLQSSFYQRYRRKMDRVANRMNCSSTYIYSKVLKRVNESYDLEKCEKLFVKETGHAPKYTMDLLTYFEELGEVGGEFVDRIEEESIRRYGE